MDNSARECRSPASRRTGSIRPLDSPPKLVSRRCGSLWTGRRPRPRFLRIWARIQSEPGSGAAAVALRSRRGQREREEYSYRPIGEQGV